jgi:RNA polymerase sigma-70 factor (ECF subfamily)
LHNRAPAPESPTVDEPSQHASDLALAAACAATDPVAMVTFDALLVEVVRRAVRRIDSSPGFADVVTQELRTRLLTGERPRIREYQGKSSLRSWLTTAAVRAALNARRGAKERPHESVGSGIRALGAEPEIALLRARARGELATSVGAALGRLPPRDRALLRLSVVDGVGVEGLARMYGVTKSTSARWLASAREALRRLVRDDLCARLVLTPTELESFVHALSDDIDVSVGRLLAEGEGGEPGGT